MTQWYIARSKSRKEKVLIGNLARWGVGTFFPYIRSRGVRTNRLEPLFPGYVFCRFDAAAPEWQAIRWSPGLSYFLTSGDDLSVVSDGLIVYLKDQTRQWNSGDMRVEFAAGDQVTVVQGPFAGFDAVFEQYMAASERCRILLRSIQGIRSLELPESDIDNVARGWRAQFGT